MERGGLAEEASAGPASPPVRAVSPEPASPPSSNRRPSPPPPAGPAAAADAAIAELAAEGLSAPALRDIGGPQGERIAVGRGRLALADRDGGGRDHVGGRTSGDPASPGAAGKRWRTPADRRTAFGVPRIIDRSRETKTSKASVWNSSPLL